MGGKAKKNKSIFLKGLADGLPVGLGYLSVSFTFGIMAVSSGFPGWSAVLISMSNLTSAGQFAALPLIASGSVYLELALTQFIINLRYTLMSISMAQKFNKSIKFSDRIWAAFFCTDEIFVISSGKEEGIDKKYYIGLVVLPYIGWATGTLIGVVAGGFLPQTVRSALGIAIYAMFIAIIIPPARKSRAVAATVLIAVVFSCFFYYLPVLRDNISSGFVIIICTVITSVICALLFPVKEQVKAEEECEVDNGDI